MTNKISIQQINLKARSGYKLDTKVAKAAKLITTDCPKLLSMF